MSDYDDDFESDASPTKSGQSSTRQPVVAKRVSRTNSAPRSTKQTHETAGAKRSASSLGRRVISESSALVPLTSEEQSIYEELKRINVVLRAELLDLNRQLDEQLGRHGQKVSRVHCMPKGTNMLPSDRLSSKNEQLRRANAELREVVQRPHMQIITETANAVGHQQKLLETELSEAKGLENVLLHQHAQLDRITLVENEMADSKRQHDRDLQEWKELVRSYKESRETEMATYNKLMRQVERLEEKLRVQDEVGAAVKSVVAVSEEVSEKDRMIDALKYQVAVLSKTNGTDKKRAQALNDRVSRELNTLKEEAESLRRQLKALGMAGELGVDTRM